MDRIENNILIQKKFYIEGGNFTNAGWISDQVKKILREAGFPQKIIRRVSIATFEAEMNVICYAKRGELSLVVTPRFLKVIVEDEGNGILDVNLAMREGYSTADEKIRELGFGAGMGLPNIKRNSDEMTLTSQFKQGTHLEFMIYLEKQENSMPFK